MPHTALKKHPVASRFRRGYETGTTSSRHAHPGGRSVPGTATLKCGLSPKARRSRSCKIFCAVSAPSRPLAVRPRMSRRTACGVSVDGAGRDQDLVRLVLRGTWDRRENHQGRGEKGDPRSIQLGRLSAEQFNSWTARSIVPQSSEADRPTDGYCGQRDTHFCGRRNSREKRGSRRSLANHLHELRQVPHSLHHL